MIQLNMTEYLTAYQPKITIYIPDMEIEQQAHEPKIDRPNNFPVQGIGAINFVAVDNVDAILHHRDQLTEFKQVILAVAIGIKTPDLWSHYRNRISRHRRIRGSAHEKSISS